MSRYLVLGQLWEKGHKIHAVSPCNLVRGTLHRVLTDLQYLQTSTGQGELCTVKQYGGMATPNILQQYI